MTFFQNPTHAFDGAGINMYNNIDSMWLSSA